MSEGKGGLKRYYVTKKKKVSSQLLKVIIIPITLDMTFTRGSEGDM